MTLPLRMPNGVMDWLENGHTVTSQAEAIAAEAASRRGDPRTYERALERRANRKPRQPRPGKSPFTMITDAMGLTGPLAAPPEPVLAEVTITDHSICSRCECPLPAGAPAWVNGDELLCADCAPRGS